MWAMIKSNVGGPVFRNSDDNPVCNGANEIRNLNMQEMRTTLDC